MLRADSDKLYTICSVLRLADKYEAPIVGDIARLQLRRFVHSSPGVIFGLAVAAGALDLAHEALKHFDGADQTVEAASARPVSPPTGVLVEDSYAPRRRINPFPRSNVVWDRRSSSPPAPSVSSKKRARDLTLSDVPIEYLRAFSAETIHNFSRLQDDDTRSWAQKATSFKVRMTPSHRF